MNSKQSIEEAARLLDIPAKDLEKVIAKVEEIIKSDAAKEYWFEQSKREQKPVEEDATVKMLDDIISWEKDLSEYHSLEGILRERYKITKR